MKSLTLGLLLGFLLFQQPLQAQDLPCPAAVYDQMADWAVCSYSDYICQVHVSNSRNCISLGCYIWTDYGLNVRYIDPGSPWYQLGACSTPETWVPATSGTSFPTLNSRQSACITSPPDINVDSLALYEEIPLVGIPFDLSYASDRFRTGFVFSPKALGLGGWYPSNLHRYDVTNHFIYFGSGGQRPIEAQPSGANLQVTSEDGRELYRFDASGKHLQTRNALTDALDYEFAYDAAGKISQMRDRYGNTTSFQYLPDQVNIFSPNNQQTVLSLDANGMLASATNPNNEFHKVTYTPKGFLRTYTKPGGQRIVVTYDSNGYVTKETGAGGNLVSLLSSFDDLSDTQTVTATTALGRETVYTTSATALGADRTTIDSAGAFTGTVNQDQGTNSSQDSTGTIENSVLEQDPRYGWMSPYEKTKSITIANSAIDIKIDTIKSLANSVLTTTTTLQNDPGRTFAFTYDMANRMFQATSPLNRTVSMNLDPQGAVSQLQVASLPPVNISYDALGHVTQIGQLDRTLTVSYDVAGNIATLTDVSGNVTHYAYDNANRITKVTLPNGRVMSMRYNRNGELVSLTPPGRPAHRFTYDLMEFVSGYLPPAVNAQLLGQETYEYDLDGQLVKLTRPSGDTLSLTYHPTTGLVASVASPSESISLVHFPAGSLLKTASHSSGLNLDYSYAGKMLKSVKTSGLLSNQVHFSFNPDASVNDIQVLGSNGVGSSVALQYDNDGLLIKSGSASFVRNDFGAISRVDAGQLQSNNSFNQFGEIIKSQSKYLGKVLATFTYTRDSHGRIASEVASVNGISGSMGKRSRKYKYDALGRLMTATTDGVATKYKYDSNGNRISKVSGNETITAEYDTQDRLLRYGNAFYTYNSNGELVTKAEDQVVGGTTVTLKTEYAYDSFGNLAKVILPDLTTIEYLIDGQGRRVGKKVNGALVESYIYQSQTQIAAVAGPTGVITKRFVYGEKINTPDLMIMDGQEYRIISDHIGTPRLVVDLSNGNVLGESQFDEFGNDPLLSGSYVLPFGFSGGLFDRDTQLVHFGAREYDPVVGRWTSKDPILFAGGDLNLYGYVVNDPVNFIDPLGLEGFGVIGGGVDETGIHWAVAYPMNFPWVSLPYYATGKSWSLVAGKSWSSPITPGGTCTINENRIMTRREYRDYYKPEPGDVILKIRPGAKFPKTELRQPPANNVIGIRG